eukprot:SM008981S23877  [mRNA]  locus=s8981:270:549:+ [translate_table: standard]
MEAPAAAPSARAGTTATAAPTAATAAKAATSSWWPIRPSGTSPTCRST